MIKIIIKCVLFARSERGHLAAVAVVSFCLRENVFAAAPKKRPRLASPVHTLRREPQRGELLTQEGRRLDYLNRNHESAASRVSDGSDRIFLASIDLLFEHVSRINI